MTFTEALEADRAEDIERAARLYEDAYEAGTELELLINLAVLYWQVTDPGLAAAKHLSRDFLELAFRRTRELLREAEQLYPLSSAPKFWKRYIAWADLGEELDSKFCEELLREEPDHLEPAMYVFTQSQGRKGADEAKLLLAQAKAAGTARGRYIASVLESAMHNASLRR